MFGIPFDGPDYISGDNKYVLYNTTIPGSTLKTKSNAIALYFVREGCAKDEWRTTYVNTHLNSAQTTFRGKEVDVCSYALTSHC